MAQPCPLTYKHALPPTISVASNRRERRKRADTDGSVSTKHQSVMSSSPKKSPEEHASLQTTEAGGSNAKEDTKYDMKKLMEKLKRTGTKREYKRVPPGLRDLIDRLCTEHDVKHAAWTQSADWREVKILGRGATGILDELRETAKSEFPEYRFIAIESGPSHTTKLCSSSSRALHVVAEHASAPPAQGTSELILEGRPKSSKWAKVYISCTAHGVLTEKQWNELDTSYDIHRIKTIRGEVEKSSTKYTLRAQLNNNNNDAEFALSGPPLICSHHFYTDGKTCPVKRCEGDALPKCPHMYENDIALLPLDGHTVAQLREGLGDKFQPFDGIVHFTRQQIDEFIDKDILVYVQDSECLLLHGLTVARKDEGYKEGEHIRFVVDKGEKLDGGDSGSVLYVEYDDEHLAFAMLVSKLGSEDDAKSPLRNDSEPEYTAILLRRALDDIGADYKIEALDLLKPAATPDQC